jgi:hypothetical protein
MVVAEVSNVFEIARTMHNDFLMRHGIAPDALLVPTSRLRLFADACMADSGGQLEADLVLRGLEHDERWLKIHDMTVYPSDTAGDLMVTNLAASDAPRDDIDAILAGMNLRPANGHGGME